MEYIPKGKDKAMKLTASLPLVIYKLVLRQD